MSNIYIQEPPTTGKVMIKTSIGDIDIELWTRETPKACRNFIKLCYDGYYNSTIFHRVIKGFIAQGGDPLGTGEGGESIFGQPFKNEFHSRLRFCRRGLVAMANSGNDDNGSQFFFTLGATPELQNKHTIFGKVTGETLYNVLKFEECLVDKDDRPVYPPKIIKTQVLNNPFEDIVPSEISKEKDEKKEKEKEKKDKKGVKDFKLLSFGEEAEEDEEEFKELNKKFIGKIKSAHDVLDDPKLSSKPALEQTSCSSSEHRSESRRSDDSNDEENGEKELVDIKKRKEMSSRAIEKLKEAKRHKENNSKKIKANEDEDEEKYYLGKDHADERKRMAEAIKKEIRDFKREIQKEKTQAAETTQKEKQKEKEKQERNEVKKQLVEQQKKYKEEKQKLKSLGDDFVMQKLMKFRNRIQTVKEKYSEKPEELEEMTKKDKDDEVIDETILALSFRCEDETPVLAKDANLKDDDWFEIYDPRNPINKRRRGEVTKKGDSDGGKNRPPRT